MSNTPTSHDDEIDLFELFETLWEGKWKILGTAIIAAIISLGVSFSRPNVFHGSTPLYKAQHYIFAKYLSINQFLQEKGFEYFINSEHVFNLFIAEFRDYKEVIEILNDNVYVKKLLVDLEEENLKNAVTELAKKFEIEPPNKKIANWTIKFEWHDEEEAKLIFNRVIEKVLSNVRRKIAFDIAEMANVIKTRNRLLIEELNAELSALEYAIFLRNKKRLLFLEEQSLIAKELGIERNILDNNSLAKGKNAGVSLSVTSSEVPFYLRGHKAIDKEIALLTSREKENILLIDPEYVATKIKLASIQQDVSVQQIHSLKEEIVITDEPTNWIQYDLALSDVESKKKPILHLVFSMIFGGVIGVMYVFFSKTIRNSRKTK